MGVKSELDHFTKLGYKNDSVRYKSGRMILSILRRDRDVETLVYTLKRLITGLGGTKLRGGCFATLTSLLLSMPEHLINFETYDYFIKNCLSPTKGDTRKEIGDAYLGQLLAYAAIINTDFLNSESSEVHQAVAIKLITIAQKKSYLHHPALVYLGKLTSKYKIEKLPDSLKNHLMQLDVYTLDKLYYLLCLSHNEQSEIVNAVFNTDSSDMMDDKIIIRIANILLKCSSEFPIGHPFFDLLAKKMSVNIKKFRLFWEAILVNKELFSEKKVTMVLHLIAHILENINTEGFVVDILDISLVRILYDKGKKDINVKSILNRLVALIKNTGSHNSYQLLMKIVFQADCVLFDRNTGVRVVDILIQRLDFTEIKSLSEALLSVLDGSWNMSKKTCWTELEKTQIFIYYSKLLTHKSTESKKKWRCRHLTNTAEMALFIPNKYKINSTLSGVISDFFFNTCGNISKRIEVHSYILARLVSYIHEKISSGDKLRKELKPEVYQKWTECFKFFFRVYEESLSMKTEDSVKILQLLAFYVLIRTFRNPKGSFDELEGLINLYQSAVSQDVKNVNTGDHWTVQFVDFLVSLLSIPLYGNRKFVVLLFKHMVKYITLEALRILINALVPGIHRNPDKITDLDFNPESNDSDEEYDCNSIGSNNSDSDAVSLDVERPGVEGVLSIKDGRSDNALSDNIFDLSDTSFRNLTSPVNDTASINLDDADEDEVNRLDQLSVLLMKNLKIKRKKKLSQNEITHNRIRLLDLIEVCCKQFRYINFEFWLDLLPVLVSLFKDVSREETEIPLYYKIRSCLKKLNSIPFGKYQILTLHITRVETLIIEIIDDVQKGLSASYRNALLNLTIPLVQALNAHKDRTTKEEDIVTGLMLRHLEEMFLSRSRIPITYYFMLSEINWEGMNSLVTLASKFIFESSFKFHRRTDGIRIIKHFLANELNFIKTPKTVITNLLNSVNNLDLIALKECTTEDHKNLCCCKPQVFERFILELISLLEIIGKKDILHQLTCQNYIAKCNGIAEQLREELRLSGNASSSNAESQEIAQSAQQSTETQYSSKESSERQFRKTKKRKAANVERRLEELKHPRQST